MNYLECEGIVINKKDYGEADRYVDVFTNKYGKISFGVKQIRKSQKREATSTDIMTVSKFIFYKKNDKIIVSNFTVIDSYVEIRESIENFEIGLCIIGILNNILMADEPNAKIYNITKKTLDVLKLEGSQKRNYLLLAYYIYFFIKNEGLKYDISSDGLYFSLENSRFYKNKQSNNFISIPNNVREIMNKLYTNQVRELLSESNGITIDDIKEAINIFERYIKFHLEINLFLKNYLMGVENDGYCKNN
ncbi:MAG: DNA repair protein RecO [Fusobacteriaceae bacterium]|jgi:DNA repair protein RecO (recombination protein O)|nr:DNA repair protein RecO [Fusobacteriaceae bacterium]